MGVLWCRCARYIKQGRPFGSFRVDESCRSDLERSAALCRHFAALGPDSRPAPSPSPQVVYPRCQFISKCLYSTYTQSLQSSHGCTLAGSPPSSASMPKSGSHSHQGMFNKQRIEFRSYAACGVVLNVQKLNGVGPERIYKTHRCLFWCVSVGVQIRSVSWRLQHMR